MQTTASQVVALDRMELSSRHITQNIMPRVKVFDHESVKKAIEAISSHCGSDTIFAGVDVSPNLYDDR